MLRSMAIIFSWGPRLNHYILFGIKKFKKKNSNYGISTYISYTLCALG